MELHRDVACAGDLEDAGRNVAVERDLAIRVVVRDEDVVPPAELDSALEVVAGCDRRRGIVGIIEVDELGARHDVLGDVGHLEQELRARREGVQVRLGARQHRAAVIDGVAGIGHDGDVARVEHRRREVRDALLRAEQRVDLRERIECQPETPLQVRRGRLAKGGEADLVAAHRRILNRLRQRLDGHARRREVRVAGADVDQVHPLLQQPPLDRGQLGHRVPG